jgi:hypothetical protein
MTYKIADLVFGNNNQIQLDLADPDQIYQQNIDVMYTDEIDDSSKGAVNI